MRDQTRYSLSGGLSIVLHVLFIAVFAWSLRVEDEPEFERETPDWEIELVDFDIQEIQPDAAQGEPEPEWAGVLIARSNTAPTRSENNR